MYWPVEDIQADADLHGFRHPFQQAVAGHVADRLQGQLLRLAQIAEPGRTGSPSCLDPD